MQNLTKLVLMSLLLTFMVVGFANAQSVKDRFNGIIVDHDAIIGGDVDIAGALDVTGASTFTGAQTFTGAASLGDATLSGLVNIAPTSYALTGAQTLTPTVSYYELAPAAVLTLTLGTGSAGDYLILANTVTTSTVIVDTGATVGGGNITLGENDIAEFINVDGTWAEISSPDNS